MPGTCVKIRNTKTVNLYGVRGLTYCAHGCTDDERLLDLCQYFSHNDFFRILFEMIPIMRYCKTDGYGDAVQRFGYACMVQLE